MRGHPDTLTWWLTCRSVKMLFLCVGEHKCVKKSMPVGENVMAGSEKCIYYARMLQLRIV